MREFLESWGKLSALQRVLMTALFVVLVAGGLWLVFGDGFSQADNVAERSEGEASADEDIAEANVKLTDEQARTIESYGEEEQELVGRLKNGLWSTLDESETVTFTDRTYTVSGEPTHSYAITALMETNANPYAGGDTMVDQYAAISTDEGTGILVMHRSVNADGEDDALEMTAYKGSIFLRYGVAQAIEIAGDLDKLAALVGEETTAEFVREVRAQADQYYPTATKATWSAQADFDWEEGKVKTSFTLNNSSAADIELEADIEKAKPVEGQEA